jgi:hypothetical protein
MQSFPWELAPELTEGRLRKLAATIERARSGALDGHDPEQGDSDWSLGCRAYSRTCGALSKLALAEAKSATPWFTAEFEGLACLLRIGGVPIKFYHGSPNDPSQRALRGLDAAARDALSGQTSLFSYLPSYEAREEWHWLMAVETHGAGGSVSSVVIFQATVSGSMRNPWPIPLEERIPTLAEVTDMQREGVDLPPPVVGPKTEIQEASSPDVSGGNFGQGQS